MENMEDRYSRQRGIIEPHALAQTKAIVIGVGGIGRQVAMQLASLGIIAMDLIDFDTVEISNCVSQGYLESHVGKYKVDCLSDDCLAINSAMAITTHRNKIGYEEDYLLPTIDDDTCIFICVDSIDARKEIWKLLKNEGWGLYIDGRMSAESLEVYSVFNDKDSKKGYQKTFFASDEAYQGTCTTRSTIYCANICGGLMVAQLSKHLRNLTAAISPKIELNILSSEWEANHG